MFQRLSGYVVNLPHPARRVNVRASSYSAAPEGGIHGHLFLAFPTHTNICEQDLCYVSTVKCTLCRWLFPMPGKTMLSPARGVKIPA